MLCHRRKISVSTNACRGFLFFAGKERKYLPRMRKFHLVIPCSRLISFPVRKKISIYAVVEKKKTTVFHRLKLQIVYYAIWQRELVKI